MDANQEQKEEPASVALDKPSLGSKATMSETNTSSDEKIRPDLDAETEASTTKDQIGMDTSDFITGIPLVITLFALIFIMVRLSIPEPFTSDGVLVLLFDGDDNHLDSDPTDHRRIPVAQGHCRYGMAQRIHRLTRSIGLVRLCLLHVHCRLAALLGQGTEILPSEHSLCRQRGRLQHWLRCLRRCTELTDTYCGPCCSGCTRGRRAPRNLYHHRVRCTPEAEANVHGRTRCRVRHVECPGTSPGRCTHRSCILAMGFLVSSGKTCVRLTRGSS